MDHKNEIAHQHYHPRQPQVADLRGIADDPSEEYRARMAAAAAVCQLAHNVDGSLKA